VTPKSVAYATASCSGCDLSSCF